MELIRREFDGTAIHQRPDDGYMHVNPACKMYRKRWGHYWENDATQEFVAALASDVGIPISQLVISKKGNSALFKQGTWVHPLVAIHFAQWLDPRFAVQVSKWVHELATTGKVANRKDTRVLLDELIEITSHGFTGVNKRLDVVEDRLGDVEREVANNAKRRNFSKTVLCFWLEVVREEYDGKCPCCYDAVISSGEFEADHYISRSKNGKRDGWPVCLGCHHGLTHGTLRTDRHHMWMLWSERIEELRGLFKHLN